MNAALITVIESDQRNIDSNNTHHVRLFEQEAVRAFTSWRANAGAFAQIDIYAVCITDNTISEATKRKFDAMGVTYIERLFPETREFSCGFYNKPLGCKFLEEVLPHDYLIHIDLDMYVMREPLIRLETSCMVYDPIQRQVERIHADGSITETYNTCLMVTKRSDLVFAKWWDKLQALDRAYRDNPEYYHEQYPNLEYRKLEELSFDLLSKDIPVRNIPNLIFGETYTPLNEIPPTELCNICFHHYHIYPSLQQYNWIQDIREWNRRFL